MLQVSGTWYRKAKVSNANITELEKPMEEFPFIARVLEKGHIEITVFTM